MVQTLPTCVNCWPTLSNIVARISTPCLELLEAIRSWNNTQSNNIQPRNIIQRGVKTHSTCWIQECMKRRRALFSFPLKTFLVD